MIQQLKSKKKQRKGKILDEKQFKLLSEKMDIIINLLVLDAVEGKQLKDQVLKLSSVGFQPKQIAEALGKTPNHIRVLLHELRKESGTLKDEGEDLPKTGKPDESNT